MNHFISLEKAVSMTTHYRNRKEALLLDAFKGKNINPVSETFDRTAVEALLAQNDCTGIRIYYGMQDNDQIHAILVGVDSENRDILPAAPATFDTLNLTDSDTGIVELGIRCPSDCPPKSSLNP